MVDLHEAAETLLNKKCPHCGDECTDYYWCKHCGDITLLDEYIDDQLDKVNAKIYRPIESSGSSKTTAKA